MKEIGAKFILESRYVIVENIVCNLSVTKELVVCIQYFDYGCAVPC